MKLNMQEKLDEIYNNDLNKAELKDIFNADTQKVSAPLLLNINNNYLNSNLKIMFIGKETNLWWGKLQNFIDYADSTSILTNRYNAHFFGGTVVSSKNKNEFKEYKAEQWKNPFFTQFKKIRKELLGDKKGSLVWNNLLKMDSGEVGTYSKNTKNDPRVVSISKNIFVKEFNLLKPDIAIFATSHTYDKVIKDFFPDYETLEIIEPKSLWKFKIGNTICYRTWHPSTIKYNAKKDKLLYYDDIILDIKKEFNL